MSAVVNAARQNVCHRKRPRWNCTRWKLLEPLLHGYPKLICIMFFWTTTTKTQCELQFLFSIAYNRKLYSTLRSKEISKFHCENVIVRKIGVTMAAKEQWNNWIHFRTIWALHRSLKSNSHKRFCTRDLACCPYILGHGESKKDCLNLCRNRNFVHKMH